MRSTILLLLFGTVLGVASSEQTSPDQSSPQQSPPQLIPPSDSSGADDGDGSGISSMDDGNVLLEKRGNKQCKRPVPSVTKYCTPKGKGHSCSSTKPKWCSNPFCHFSNGIKTCICNRGPFFNPTIRYCISRNRKTYCTYKWRSDWKVRRCTNRYGVRTCFCVKRQVRTRFCLKNGKKLYCRKTRPRGWVQFGKCQTRNWVRTCMCKPRKVVTKYCIISGNKKRYCKSSRPRHWVQRYCRVKDYVRTCMCVPRKTTTRFCIRRGKKLICRKSVPKNWYRYGKCSTKNFLRTCMCKVRQVKVRHCLRHPKTKKLDCRTKPHKYWKRYGRCYTRNWVKTCWYRPIPVRTRFCIKNGKKLYCKWKRPRNWAVGGCRVRDNVRTCMCTPKKVQTKFCIYKSQKTKQGKRQVKLYCRKSKPKSWIVRRCHTRDWVRTCICKARQVVTRYCYGRRCSSRQPKLCKRPKCTRRGYIRTCQCPRIRQYCYRSKKRLICKPKAPKGMICSKKPKYVGAYQRYSCKRPPPPTRTCYKYGKGKWRCRNGTPKCQKIQTKWCVKRGGQWKCSGNIPRCPRGYTRARF